MKTNLQKLAQSQIELRIEVSVEELKPFLEKAVSHLGEGIEIQGFRKGKAPKEMVEAKVSKEAIFQHAVEDCVRESYIQAVKENNLEPLGQPEIEILKIAPDNPLEFKAKCQALPEITLPDYQEIAAQIRRKEIKVTEEEIERLKKEKERAEKERLRDEILEKIAERTQLVLPDILVQSEQQRTLESLKAQVPQILQITFEDYLKKVNKTEKELLDSFAAQAEKKVKSSLVLREIVKKENIQVSEAELEKEIAEFTKANPNLDKRQLKEYTESVLKNEKTLEKLESFVRNS